MIQPVDPTRGRVAVIGAGVAGLTAAWMLQRKQRVDLYENNDYPGGHTRTITIEEGPDAGTPIDMGFIVMNHRNYPLFTRLLERLDVALGDSDMSFGYQCERTGYAYAGTNLGSLFARTANVFSPRHWSMLSDIVRFNKTAAKQLQAGQVTTQALGDYLETEGYGQPFAEHYLLAMGSAIWSSPGPEIREFPAKAFVQFFHNHGLLTLNDRPQWRYVKGGSQTYVRAMLNDFSGTCHLNQPIHRIRRVKDGVHIELPGGEDRLYDRVVLACHADEALALLADPTPEEQRLLGAWRYQPNEAVLHTDPSVMPRARRAWASWNFWRPGGEGDEDTVSITYHMNRLQQLQTRRPYFVSLNRRNSIPDDACLHRETFTHPVYTFDAINSQEGLKALNGRSRTFFCGSYFGNGFHEDAVRSAVEVAGHFGEDL
jgi:predicted NAD/FAD-binding protein